MSNEKEGVFRIRQTFGTVLKGEVYTDRETDLMQKTMWQLNKMTKSVQRRNTKAQHNVVNHPDVPFSHLHTAL